MALLAGCAQTGAPPSGDDLPRTDTHATGVDGLMVGHRLMAAGEYELALRAYLRAAAEDGLSVDVLSALGSANLKLGRMGQAEQLLRQAVALDPRFVPALNNLGCVLMAQGKYGEARGIFQQAFMIDSGATDALRENLRRAIAASEGAVRDPNAPDGDYSLVRRGANSYDLLTRM